ncbi:hypothetical protein, partial [Pseudomonas viridiflava]|uniref:hypothetical protein n=1 Tax=Pseudomonas viridiflava TaxID=33069 RepID=UPI00197CFA70
RQADIAPLIIPHAPRMIVPTLRSQIRLNTDHAHRSEVGMPPVTLRVTNGTDCGFGEPSA